MAWEFLKKIPSPLTVKIGFREHGRWFEAGDPCDWMKLAIGVRKVYKLIHDGFLEDPFSEAPKSKSEAKRKKVQKKAAKKKKKKKAAKKELAPVVSGNSEKPAGSEE